MTYADKEKRDDYIDIIMVRKAICQQDIQLANKWIQFLETVNEINIISELNKEIERFLKVKYFV